MNTDRHRAEYELRVNRVMDHVREHRAEELTVERLAGVAAFSPFHFHRIFKAVTGENLMEHVARIRVEAAATQLVLRPHADVLEIALDNGFGSASAFARAFKARFGMTATEWRKLSQADRNRCQAERKAGEAGALDEAHGVDMISSVDVKQLPGYHLAYLRNTGPYGPGSGIPDLWRRLQTWATARDLWTPDRVCLGIAHDDPMVTEAARCRYDAAIVIPPGLGADGGVNVAELPAGKHAVLAFEGGVHQIGAAWGAVYAWLRDSGYQPDDRVGFERYTGAAWEELGGPFRCEICVPIRPL